MTGVVKHTVGSLRLLPACALLASAPLVNGCAAAMFAPAVLAGGAITQVGMSDGSSEEVAPTVPAVVPPALIPTPAALPPRGALDAANPWQPFADYALERGRGLGGPDPVTSALLVSIRSFDWPDRLPCEATTPGVLIDLDEGSTAFIPGAGAHPALGLAEALARLREAGFAVLWISGADANRVTEIAEALRASGLDPAGRDPLLLVRNPDERKQVMRIEANESVCILAIAGDRRSDFDELFDYLRVPESEAGLDTILGDGWFLTPLPLAAAG